MMQDLATASARAFLRNAARVLMEEADDTNTTGLTNSSDTFANTTDNTAIVDGDSTTNSAGEFDPKVFWSVNAFIFVMVVTICCFYYHNSDKAWFPNQEERRRQSDDVYRQALRERLEQEEARKKETPEQRTRKLLQSFNRHKVQMVRCMQGSCKSLRWAHVDTKIRPHFLSGKCIIDETETTRSFSPSISLSLSLSHTHTHTHTLQFFKINFLVLTLADGEGR